MLRPSLSSWVSAPGGPLVDAPEQLSLLPRTPLKLRTRMVLMRNQPQDPKAQESPQGFLYVGVPACVQGRLLWYVFLETMTRLGTSVVRTC